MTGSVKLGELVGKIFWEGSLEVLKKTAVSPIHRCRVSHYRGKSGSSISSRGKAEDWCWMAASSGKLSAAKEDFVLLTILRPFPWTDSGA